MLWVSSAAHESCLYHFHRAQHPRAARVPLQNPLRPQPFPHTERAAPQHCYPGLPKELAFKFRILANTLRFTGCLSGGCEDPRDGLGLLSTQASYSFPAREVAHPCQALLLTLMLQKILREHTVDLLGTPTGDLLASGWTPIVGASHRAPNSWATHRALCLPRRRQPTQSVPKTLQACE